MSPPHREASPEERDASRISKRDFDTEDTKRIFRDSPCMPAKWDSPRGEYTYARDTIETALTGINETYEPAIPAEFLLPTGRPHPGEQATRLKDARLVFSKWLYLPNDDHIVAAFGTVAANLLSGDPVWMLFVGPPGSGKTEAVQPLAGLPYVHPAATLTEPALLSGVPKKSTEKGATGGLLRQVGDFGILLSKDFSGVLSMHRDARTAVLAALREVYDGSWARPVGTGGGKVLKWAGKTGLIGAVTPSIDRHSAVMGALGERFVLYRLDDQDNPNQKGRKALDNFGNQEAMRAELSEAASAVLKPIGRYQAPPLTEDDKDRLTRIAGFVVKARTAVERDGYSRTIQAIPEHEHSTRLVLQLAQLRAGILEIGADSDTAWRIVTKAGFDSIPRLRWRILTALRGAEQPMLTSDLVESTGIPARTLKEHAEDLDLLELISRTKTGAATNSPWVHRLADGVRGSWPNPPSRSVR